jgi:predicted Zn-dependent protease with MMP-like domain
MRRFGPPPSLDEIDALARAALARLPRAFADHSGALTITVEEFADDSTLASMGIEDPFELSGLYVGHPLTERSVGDSHTLPDRVFLYRAPILDEWAAGEDSLEALVAHVLVHEVGHHFGLSDEDMAALEGLADAGAAQ